MDEAWTWPRRVGGVAAAPEASLGWAEIVGGDQSLSVRLDLDLGLDDAVDEALRRGVGRVLGVGPNGLVVSPAPVASFVRPLPEGAQVLPEVEAGREPSAPGWVVHVVRAELDSARWRARPAVVSGSCEPLFETLARGQTAALAALQPYFEAVDERLRRRYRTRLDRGATAWQAALERARAGASGHDTCLAQLASLEEEVARCRQGDTCAAAPRVFLREQVFIGEVGLEDGGATPCDGIVDPSTAAALREPARLAADDVAGQMEPGWTALADRAAALVFAFETLERVCEPRRRRISGPARASTVARVEGLVASIGEPIADPSVTWATSHADVHVPGWGKVHALAMAHGAQADRLRAEVVTIEADVHGATSCSGPFEQDPLALIVTLRGEPVAMYYAYPEELWCAEVDR